MTILNMDYEMASLAKSGVSANFLVVDAILLRFFSLPPFVNQKGRNSHTKSTKF